MVTRRRGEKKGHVVIPGLRKAQDPESRYTLSVGFSIPGSLLRSAPE
jgi:hypothetical protein